jgi:hypothetical protein
VRIEVTNEEELDCECYMKNVQGGILLLVCILWVVGALGVVL